MFTRSSPERVCEASTARDVWIRRAAISLLLLLALLALCFVLLERPSLEDAPADITTAQPPIGVPRVEADFRRMLDDLVDTAIVGKDDERQGYASAARAWIGGYYARTPCGAECFRQMLRDPRSARALFAARMLSLSGDSANLWPLLAFAEQHVDDEELFGAAESSMLDLGATGLYRLPGETPIAARVDTLRRWRELFDGRSKRGPLPKSYEQFWGSQLASRLKDLVKTGDWQLYQVGVFEADFKLQLSRDSSKAASFLIACLEDLKEPHYKLWIPTQLVMSLQLHVGPLDHPDLKSEEIAEKKRAVRKALEWWGQNKEKRPVEWMLARLALRGYATGKPEDVKTTADALVSALAKGKPAERYAATRILGYVLPDGGTLPAVYEDVVGACEPLSRFAPGQGPENRANARYSCLDLVLARATRWAAWECALYSWKASEGRYERVRKQ